MRLRRRLSSITFILDIFSFDRKLEVIVKNKLQKINKKTEVQGLHLNLGQRFACHGGCP